MNDYYDKVQGLAQCATALARPNESLEDNLKFQRQQVAKRLAAVDEALEQLRLHPEVQDVLEALKKVQQGY